MVTNNPLLPSLWSIHVPLSRLPQLGSLPPLAFSPGFPPPALAHLCLSCFSPLFHVGFRVERPRALRCLPLPTCPLSLHHLTQTQTGNTICMPLNLTFLSLVATSPLAPDSYSQGPRPGRCTDPLCPPRHPPSALPISTVAASLFLPHRLQASEPFIPDFPTHSGT